MKVERVTFLASVLFLSFLYGFITAKVGLFPSEYITNAVRQGRAIFDNVWGKPSHLFPAVYDNSGVRVLDSDSIQPGVTLLTTFLPELDWRPGIILIDKAGELLHLWDADPERLWPEVKRSLRQKDYRYVHGTHLFPNGDVLFNIEFQGLVRMDACGKVKWRMDYKTHHSIARDEDGNFWVSANVRQDDDNYLKQFPGLKPPVYEDHALLVSAEGEILRDINLVEVVYKNELQRYIPKISKQRKGDIFHLNDIESLSSDIAKDYPLFEAGDIVVSLRYMHIVLVLDPDTKVVKWYTSDLSIEQHDPDFTGDGWITIFDNNANFSSRGEMLGGSRILGVRPHTGETAIIYPTVASDPFYTRTGGKWQMLSNGNILVTEARAGRVFEASPDGRTVWEWVHMRYDETMVPEVLEGTRYEFAPDDVAKWPCAPANRKH